MKQNKMYMITISALLCAIGILIPLMSPIKVIIEPASFTLGSHVAIFIAMFVSPMVALSVALITTLGFLFAGFPITVVLRALSHVVFAYVGAKYLQKNPNALSSTKVKVIFAIVVSIIHAVMEVIFVLPFYMNGYSMEEIFNLLLLLVGVGTFIHSCVDFILATIVYKVLIKSNNVKKISSIKNI